MERDLVETVVVGIIIVEEAEDLVQSTIFAVVYPHFMSY